MANPYQMFETDKKAETEVGVILDYGEFQIRIARAGGSNVKYQKLVQSRLRPFQNQMDAGTMDPKVAEKLMAEIFADAIILDWTNVKDRAGNVITCNKPNIVKLFLDLPDLFRDVQRQAGATALFRIEEQEEIAKKSPAV